MESKISRLAHALYLMIIGKKKYLCWNPNDHDRSSFEMWEVHTEERLRQNIRLSLITKGD